jgi:UDP-glucose 4-epimerase
MKVLITGGAGFIGSHTCRAFLDGGDVVAVLDDLSHGRAENVPEGARLYKADVRDSAQTARIVSEEKPDALVHLAAQISVAASAADPEADARTNILGTLNVLEACKANGVKSVVLASSAAVYGEPSALALTEEHLPAPISPYGLSKLACERYLAWYGMTYGINCAALRYANVYGPGQDAAGEGGVAAVFADKLLSGQTPVIHGDGGQTRDFVYVGDVARANRMAAIYPDKLNTVMNIGTGAAVSVNDLLREMGTVLGIDPNPGRAPSRQGDIRHSRLSGEKALKIIGWRPMWSLIDGIKRLLNLPK